MNRNDVGSLIDYQCVYQWLKICFFVWLIVGRDLFGQFVCGLCTKRKNLKTFFVFEFSVCIFAGVKKAESMTQHEKVIGHVSQMIKSLGVKSVRMDDVANELGMSKRTLYEMFSDKEELLYESLCYMMDQHTRTLTKLAASCDSMLEILLLSVRELCKSGVSSEMECRLVINLKKFYPNMFERIQRYHAEQGLANLQYALDKCREEGYLDEHADIELMAQLFLTNMGVIMSGNNISLPEGVSKEKAFSVLIINFLRGLASVEGLRKIDEILAREKQKSV